MVIFRLYMYKCPLEEDLCINILENIEKIKMYVFFEKQNNGI